jgi:hypothetical protein
MTTKSASTPTMMSQVRVRLLRVKVEPEGMVMAMARNHRRNDAESSGDGQLSFQSSDTVTVISADFLRPPCKIVVLNANGEVKITSPFALLSVAQLTVVESI